MCRLPGPSSTARNSASFMPRIVRRTTKQKSSKRATASDALGRPRLRGRRGIGRPMSRLSRGRGHCSADGAPGARGDGLAYGRSLGFGHNRCAFRRPIRRRLRGTIFAGRIGRHDHCRCIVDAGAYPARTMHLRTAGGRRAHHHSMASIALRDAHELAHADEIRRQFVSRNVTTGQIVLFGLSGGPIPSSAAIAVLAFR